MKVKNCLITAAGLGTRMGKLGLNLPKPLWPVFEVTLLDLQLEYVKRFKPDKVFVNVHHVCDKIRDWAIGKDVTILYEKELLGSGGCVHNLKKYLEKDQSGVTCVVNSDQFFMLEETNIDKGIELIEKGYDQVIYGMKVNKHEKYNETYAINNKLLQIRKNEGLEDYYTYSGVCLLNLEKIDYVEGVSSFFDSVCNFKKNDNIYFYDDTSNVEFWDFGEKAKYVNSLIGILNKNTGTFLTLIKESNVLKEKSYLVDEIIRMHNGSVKIDLKSKLIEIDGAIDHF